MRNILAMLLSDQTDSAIYVLGNKWKCIWTSIKKSPYTRGVQYVMKTHS